MRGNTKNQIKEVFKIIIYLIALFVITFLFIKYVMQRTDVSGNSMQPALENGDTLLVDKISYRFSDPKRFDIVVFPFHDDEKTYYIKRIIGLPGETVQLLLDGSILINGEVLRENYGKEIIQNPGIAVNQITLGEDEYFVMGDNRNNSKDSRDVHVGNIKRSDLIGKAWIRIFPFSSFGVLKHQ